MTEVPLRDGDLFDLSLFLTEGAAFYAPRMSMKRADKLIADLAKIEGRGFIRAAQAHHESEGPVYRTAGSGWMRNERAGRVPLGRLIASSTRRVSHVTSSQGEGNWGHGVLLGSSPDTAAFPNRKGGYWIAQVPEDELRHLPSSILASATGIDGTTREVDVTGEVLSLTETEIAALSDDPGRIPASLLQALGPDVARVSIAAQVCAFFGTEPDTGIGDKPIVGEYFSPDGTLEQARRLCDQAIRKAEARLIAGGPQPGEP